MASYYAHIDKNNVVTEVIAVADASIYNNDGTDNEIAGVNFCKNLFGSDTNWIHTRYDGTLRKNYAGIGFSYDSIKDAFIPPQPYSKWVLNDNCEWVPPVSMPNDGGVYSWDDVSGTWIKQ